MQVAGRHDETRIMKWQHERLGSQFLAMYGRRRVGKTYLIRQVYKKETVFACTGLKDGDIADQILNFYLAIQKQTKKVMLPPKTWIQAFTLLEEYLDTVHPRKGKKKVVFIDEIPWMDTKRSGFMPAFTRFWNDYCDKQSDIILVICGSAATWIINKVVKNTGGLHNRISQAINLLPFELSEVKEMLALQKVKLSNRDIFQLHMCIGGIPYYISQVKPGQGLPQILDDLYFGKNAALKDEFQNLYESLFDNYEDHIKITKALSVINKGLSRKALIKATGLASGGGLSQTLDELTKCGFISETADADKVKSGKLYRLTDEFTIFYYKFLVGRSTINSGAMLFNSQKFKIWAGFAFENYCITHHQSIMKAMDVKGVEYKVYSFIDRGSELSTGVQIDLVIDRNDGVVNICEIKWRDQPYKMTKKEAENLELKVASYRRKTKSKKSIFTTLITSHGSDKNMHYLSAVTNEILLDELI